MAQLAKSFYVQAVDTKATHLEDGYVIYKEDQAKAIFLNPSAFAVFELCNGKRSVADIAHTLQGAFNLSESPERDIQSCVDNLLSEGLIQVRQVE